MPQSLSQNKLLHKSHSRRTFVATGVAGATWLAVGPRASARAVGANERLRIAVAGVNGRGQSHIAGWLGQPNVEIVCLIDPDER